jgi:rubrerythrin
MSKTYNNLKLAFTGEAQANLKYLAFAQRAADEYKEGIYRLFMAVAEGETIHALKHLRHMKEVKSTKENLQEALSGEIREVKSMYPQMIQKAKEEGEKGAEVTLSHAMEVERVHRELLQEAIDNLEHFPVQEYFICPACGYIAAKEAPDKCTVCGAVKDVFFRAGSEKEAGIANL